MMPAHHFGDFEEVRGDTHPHTRAPRDRRLSPTAPIHLGPSHFFFPMMIMCTAPPQPRHPPCAQVDYDVDMQRALEPVPLAAAAAAAAAPNNKSPRAPKLPGSKKSE